MVWLPDKYGGSKMRLLSSMVQKEDKTEICKLIDKLLATKIKHSRAAKYYDGLRLMVERGWIPSYHNLTEADLYHCLTEIEQSDELGVWAKRDYKLPLKLILKELNNPLADIVKPNKGRNKQQLPQAYMTVHDILKMVQSDWPHLRDKAAVACLYESCCRPHEFFMLKRRDVKFEIVPAKVWNGNGSQLKIDLEIATLMVSNGAKTGGRPVPLTFTVPWLKAWLRQNGSTDYIWTKLRGANAKEAIEYPEARKAIKQIANAAGVEPEKAHFYAERHGRSTEVSKHMSLAQQCQFAGWTQGSKMAQVYNHLSGKDVVAPLLSPFGITVESAQSERDVWLKIMKLGQEYLIKM